MRKHLMTVIVLAVVVLGASGPVAGQSRSVFWESWDVDITNVDVFNNQFRVSEQYNIYFSGLFRFGSAVIPRNNLEDIRDVQVYENGEPLNQGCSERPGTYCVVKTQDAVEVAYYFFEPLENTQQRFELVYTVVGALRVYEGGDQLWWTAVPSEHYGFSIGSSTITVQMPPGFGPREGVDPVVTYGVPAAVEVQGPTVTARANRQLDGNDFFEIRVQYPHNSSARVAGWQASFDQQRLYQETTKPLVDLAMIALSMLVAVGGVLGVYLLWYTRGRDPQVGPVPAYLTEPPSGLPPAVVGTLLDEKADVRDVMATIIDLARRGYMVLEEEKSEGLFGIGATREFTFKRTDKSLDGLRPFEQRLMNALFKSKMERTLDSLKNSFYRVLPGLQNDLYDAVVNDKLFTNRPSMTRTMWSGLGVTLFLVATVVSVGAFALVESVSPTLLCVPAALAFVGLAALIVGQYMPAKTREGAEQAAKWRAFREYLQNLDKYSDVDHVAGHFDDYLPYAIAFGIDRTWVRRFSQSHAVPIPPWYFPTHMGGPYRGGYRAGTPMRPMSNGGRGIDPSDLARAGDGGFSLDDVSSGMAGGLESISSGLTNMLESASRVMTSKPQSSSGSGSWSSGGRSWSGGGSFGGGSSGGGSRGFG